MKIVEKIVLPMSEKVIDTVGQEVIVININDVYTAMEKIAWLFYSEAKKKLLKDVYFEPYARLEFQKMWNAETEEP